jgi:hypothetical protein
MLQSFYEAVVAIKQWEEKGFPEISHPAVNFDALAKTFAYWRADYMVKHSTGIRRFYWQLRRKFKQ